MKNLIKLITLFSITLFFASCSSSDDAPQVNSKDLLGTWNLTEVTTEGTTKSTGNGVTIESTYTSLGKDYNAKLIFSENPNKFQSSGSYTSVVTTTTLGQESTINVPINNIIGAGDWEITGNTLNTSGYGDDASAEILELNESTLKLKILLDKEFTFNGVSQKTTGIVFYTLTK